MTENRLSRVIWVLVMLLISFTITETVVFSGRSEAKEPIKIGLIGTGAGGGYLVFKPCYDGIMFATNKINKEGGILGRPVEILYRDDGGKIDTGVMELKNLILRDKVHVLAGGVASPVCLAYSESARQNKTLYFTLMGNTMKLTEEKGHRYVFQFPASTRVGANA